MHWKNWPYWLRGGVIGGIIALLCFLLSYACEWTIPISVPTEENFSCLWILSPLLPIIVLANYIPFLFGISNSSLVLSFTLSYFIIGSIIGAIVGVMKKKKSSLA